MSLRSILAALRSVPPLPRTRAAGRQAGFRPRLEPLDGRVLPSFSPAVSYAAGANPYAVVTGYFNADAVLDLAVVDNAGNTVSVRAGNGNGTFGPAATSATGVGPLSVAVGDFDGDGKTDLATANAGDVSVLMGHGDGTFAPPVNIPLSDGSAPQSVAVGDFNRDGKLDLGVTSNLYTPGYYGPGYWGYYGYYPGQWYPGYDTGSAHVLMGNGLGGFADAGGTSLGYGYHTGAAVADFNGDGNPDFASGDTDTWAVSVLSGDGFGNLLGPADFPAGGPPMSVTAGDVTGDGKTDLVTANGYAETIGVLPGDGLGGFGAAQTYTSGVDTTSVALADFNHDGRPDVATTDYNTGGVNVLLGRGGGAFSPPAATAVGASAWAVAAGDFNGDGWPDAATADAGGGASVLINDHSWPPPDAPSVGINDVTVTEGNIGSLSATFTLTLSAAYSQPVTVHFATADGSATAGSDYAAGSGDVTIPAGQTSWPVTVAVLGDRLPEPTETFAVNLTAVSNGFIGDGYGVGTILDNEPRISVNDVTVTEGNTGTLNATLTVSLSAVYDQDVTVHFATANGSATAGSDYTAVTDMVVTVPAGQLSRTFTVAVIGDRFPEPTETFLVNLGSPTGNALVADGQGVVTIIDNEPRIAINDVRKLEGNGNGKNGNTQFVFTVTLSAAYDQAVTVHFATADGTAKVSNSDYVAASGTVTFAPGETTKTITVTVKGDKRRESDEWFAVNLSGASSNALIGDSQGMGWILNDDYH
jgi:hypothetical protein